MNKCARCRNDIPPGEEQYREGELLPCPSCIAELKEQMRLLDIDSKKKPKPKGGR